MNLNHDKFERDVSMTAPASFFGVIFLLLSFHFILRFISLEDTTETDSSESIEEQSINHTTKTCVFSTKTKLSTVELFVVTNHEYQMMFETILKPSIELFYPKDQLKLTIATESETENPENQEFIKYAAEFSNVSKISQDNLSIPEFYHDNGHTKQQLVMFYADKFSQHTDTEYIAFMDTDSMFVTPILPSFLFNGSKPIVQGLRGKSMGEGGWWQRVNFHDSRTIGRKLIACFMTYFPVIIKKHHFAEIRKFVRKQKNTTSFLDAFKEFSVYDEFSQFNIMLNYLFFHHREEYEWRFQTVLNGKKKKGLISLQAGDNILTEIERVPVPSVTSHWKYARRKFYKKGNKSLKSNAADPEILKKEVKIELLRGYCFAKKFQPEICDNQNQDTLQWTLFDFQADHPINCTRYDCEKMQSERMVEIQRNGYDIDFNL